MDKKTIFLSHISEEGKLGTILKNRLEEDFLNLIDVFVSSDSRSIPPGDTWLRSVDDKLSQAAALIVLASPTSVNRPWITFEAGAGWAKKVPVMIVCHSGMAPGGLPLPLSQLQAFLLTDEERLKAMYEVIARVLGSATPRSDLGNLLAAVSEFERAYTEDRDILVALRGLHKVDEEIIQVFRKLRVGVPTPIRNFPESVLRKAEEHLVALRDRGLLAWSFGVNTFAFAGPDGTGGGNMGNLTVTITPPLANALTRPEFS